MRPTHTSIIERLKKQWLGKLVRVSGYGVALKKQSPGDPIAVRKLWGYVRGEPGAKTMKSFPFATSGEYILIIDVAANEQGDCMLCAINARADICWIFSDQV